MNLKIEINFGCLQWSVERLKDFPGAFWLALFVEGTRFTPSKLLEARRFALSSHLPTPTNVLIPRTKVFFFFICLIKINNPNFVNLLSFCSEEKHREHQGEDPKNWEKNCLNRMFESLTFYLKSMLCNYHSIMPLKKSKPILRFLYFYCFPYFVIVLLF